MITKIHIKNFKGIKDKVTIDLKPITLLFGPNSSGKSTIVQALHYAREILDRRNFDPDGTKHGGQSVNLGGFKNLVYDHDLSLPVILKFEMDASNLSLPNYSSELEKDFTYYEIGRDLLDNLDVETKSISVQVKVEWHEILGKAIVSDYQVEINAQIIGAISFDNYTSDGKSTYKISFINHLHPYFPTQELEVKGEAGDISEFLLLHWGLTADLPSQIEAGEGTLDIKLPGQNTAIPYWGELLNIDRNYFNVENSDYASEDMFVEFLTKALVGPGELLRDELNKFRYIGPIREIPSRNYEPKRFKDETRWANGLGAWDTLYTSKPNFLKDVNKWMTILKAGYTIHFKEYKVLSSDSPLMLYIDQGRVYDDVDLKYEIEKLPNKKSLYLLENDKYIELLPYDIGVGVSQLIPVIVGAIEQSSSILSIEQPELHVHPAIQVNLGDLFISQIQNKNCIYLLETHSEHLMLRLLRRIKETFMAKKSNSTKPVYELNPDDLSVIYVEQQKDGIEVQPLKVDERGRFEDKWPKGFFEERHEELFP